MVVGVVVGIVVLDWEDSVDEGIKNNSDWYVSKSFINSDHDGVLADGDVDTVANDELVGAVWRMKCGELTVVRVN